MIRCFLCPSTPPYIGGGAEGFVLYKLQSPGGFPTHPVGLQILSPNTTLAFLNKNLGFRFFLFFESWAFSKPRVPPLAGPLRMPMSVAPEILLESKNQGKSPTLQLPYSFFKLIHIFNKTVVYCTGITVIGAVSSDGSGTS